MEKEDLTILIIGSGAREHALSCAYEKNPKIKKIIVAPGNDFISYNRKKEIIIDKNCSLKNPDSILEIAKKYNPDLIDVAQDDALASGTVDLLEQNGFIVFGPKKSSARIEWDKKYSREIMQNYKIPHPFFRYFENELDAIQYVKEIYSKEENKQLYVKATGLCAGKGALKSISFDEAVNNIKKMKEFPNNAGKIFLIEEGLVGEEFSYFAICDGVNYKLIKSAQDNKTIFNFDEGDQTGGMGVVSPAIVTEKIKKEIEEEQILRLIQGMAKDKNPYKGILYFSGIVQNNRLLNIEYNARWGDPECQVVLPSIETDYYTIVKSCLDGNLKNIEIIQDNKTRVCVVGTSRGYPNDYSKVKGKRIYGLDEVLTIPGISVFGAGINVIDGKFYCDGGRLFSIVAEGKDIIEAREKAYSAIARISIEGNNLHYRTDIGWRDVERLRKNSKD